MMEGEELTWVHTNLLRHFAVEGNQRNEEFSGICQMSRKFLHLKFEDTTAYLHADGNDLVNIQERRKYI